MLGIYGLLLLVFSPLTCWSYNILLLSPFPGKSHWLWVEHFQRDLLKRGHHLTSISSFPSQSSHINLTEIVINPKFDIPHHFPKKNIFTMRFTSAVENIKLYWDLGLLTTEHALNNGKVKDLIARKDQVFDLVIVEQFFHESLLMFGHKFQCPIITIGTFGYSDDMDHVMGLMTPWAVVPHLVSLYTDQMSFMQRFYNSYLSLYDIIFRRMYFMPRMQAMAEKHFGKHVEGPLPHLCDLERNISMMLVNSNRAIDTPRPTMPGFLDVGGAHLRESKPLPEDLQSFLDNSTEGVVYFSLGSYVKGTDLPFEKISMLLKALGQLKQKVLWKYENESVGVLPSNFMIRKWLPQSDILAHPNVKLFITHGGLFGTQEGIFWGKPMLCIPLYGDQHRNSMKSVRAGIARTLLFTEINEQNLVKNIEILLHDPKYRQKAKEVSAKFRDSPMHPLDAASYWIEYVIRYKGAAHLKSYGAYMPWYQYLLLDILAVCLITASVIGFILWKLLKFIYQLVRNTNATKIHYKQKTT